MVGELGRPMGIGMFLTWFKTSKLSVSTLKEKVWFAGKAGYIPLFLFIIPLTYFYLFII